MLACALGTRAVDLKVPGPRRVMTQPCGREQSQRRPPRQHPPGIGDLMTPIRGGAIGSTDHIRGKVGAASVGDFGTDGQHIFNVSVDDLDHLRLMRRYWVTAIGAKIAMIAKQHKNA